MPAGRKKIEVPEWGGVIFVRGLTGREFLHATVHGLENSAVWLAAHGIVNRKGVRLFSAGDLAEQDAIVIRRIADVVLDLSGLSQQSHDTTVKKFKENRRFRLWYELASQLGMTVETLAQRITAKEFEDWVILFGLEASESRKADIRAATICCILANCNRDPEKQSEPFKIEDFLMDWGGDGKKRDEDPAKVNAALKAWAMQMAANSAEAKRQADGQARALGLAPGSVKPREPPAKSTLPPGRRKEQATEEE